MRKNAILIKDLVTERDKLKSILAEKDVETAEMAVEIRATRAKLTDLTLIEEKTE